jgi:hypothetical protein
MAAPRQQVRFTLQDRERNTSTVTFWVSRSLSISALEGFIDTMASHIKQLSDARIIQVKCIIEYDIDNGQEAEPTSDVTRKAVFYYSNGDIYEALYLPSPRSSIFESTGRFEGIRIDPTNESVQDYILALPAIPFGLTTIEGETFPSTFVVGGLVL